MIPATTNVFLRHRAEELGLAVGLLTRYPLPAFSTRTNASINTAFWAFPIAGALIGGPAAAVFWLSVTIGLSTAASVLIATAAALLASGALHEDGLGDFWDGIGGGHSREAKLGIMRDSRIGTYGSLALFLTLGLQLSFLISLHYYSGTACTMGAIIASEAVARGAIALPVAGLKPARHDGLGASMAGSFPRVFIVGASLAILLAAILLGTLSAYLVVGALLGAGLISALAWHFLGGYTGDVLGAAVVTARMMALGALLLAVTP